MSSKLLLSRVKQLGTVPAGGGATGFSWPEETISFALQGLALARDMALGAEFVHLLPREGSRQ